MSIKKRSPWQIQKAVWYALFIRELKVKVGEHSLGPVWVVVEPLIHIGMLVFIFSFVRDRADFQGIPFAAFFAVAILPYFIFQNTINRSTRIIFQNRQLFSYRQVKPMDTIIALVMVELFISSSVLILFCAAGTWIFDYNMIPIRPIEVFFIFILLCLFSAGLGLICAVIGARWEDIGGLIPMPIRLLYFISGILIPIQELPASLHKYLLWNPLLHATEQIRAHFYLNYDPASTSINFLMVSTIISLFLGLSYFQLNRSRLLLR